MTAIVLATIALHWAGLRGAARVLQAESVGRRAASAVQLVAREVPRAPDGERVAASPPREAPSPGKATARRPVVAAATPARPGTSVDAPAETAGRADAYRFYGAKEVDVTAEPVSQWNLDPAALDALATSRIVFTLFVGRDGSILLCSVDEPERLTPEQRKALAARLARTEMRPARRAGVAVPSRRRVELYTVGGI